MANDQARTPKTNRTEFVRMERKQSEEAFRATVPVRLLDIMVRAFKVNHYSVSLVKDNAEYVLRYTLPFETDEEQSYERKVVLKSLSSEEWEFESAENSITDYEEALAERVRLREVAQTTYDSLTEEQRKALGLTKRPV